MICFAIAAADSGQDTSFFQREPSPGGGGGGSGRTWDLLVSIYFFSHKECLIPMAYIAPQAPDVLKFGTLE